VSLKTTVAFCELYEAVIPMWRFFLHL